MKNKYKQLLDEIQPNTPGVENEKRILVLDGLNLFFRNFAILNMVNTRGTHIGGLGGFFRSLGAMIRQHDPTEVYMIFDGKGSSNSRKNILPEYKSGRNVTRLTNWATFENLEEEDDAKINQIVRIVDYLQTLPIKVLSLDRSEADDIIAYLSINFKFRPQDKMFIVSSDKDYIQLINENVILYRPMEKEYYTVDTVKEKYNMTPHNFIIYKTLIGDTSDKIPGVKGLGPVKFYKLFPEIAERDITLEEVYNKAVENIEGDIIYARLVKHFKEIEKFYKIMDLSNPMICEKGINQIIEEANEGSFEYLPETFLHFYKQDELGKIIRNVDVWIKEIFEPLNNPKINKIKI